MNLLIICTVKTWTPLYATNTNNIKKTFIIHFRNIFKFLYNADLLIYISGKYPVKTLAVLSVLRITAQCPNGSMSWLLSNSYKPFTNTRGFAPGFVNLKKECTRLAAASDKVYRLLAHGRWFSPGTPAFSTTKTGPHDRAWILLNVVLITKNLKNQIELRPVTITLSYLQTDFIQLHVCQSYFVDNNRHKQIISLNLVLHINPQGRHHSKTDCIMSRTYRSL
jgi:hypothetical protein